MAMHKACIEQAKKKLEEEMGLRLQIEEGITMDSERGKSNLFYAIPTKKKNGHRGAPVIITYCPFCGKAIDRGIIWENKQ